MRIHKLVIDNVRGVEHLALRDIPDTGVILIHGDNCLLYTSDAADDCCRV